MRIDPDSVDVTTTVNAKVHVRTFGGRSATRASTLLAFTNSEHGVYARVPDSLKHALAARARERGLSLTAAVVALLGGAWMRPRTSAHASGNVSSRRPPASWSEREPGLPTARRAQQAFA